MQELSGYIAGLLMAAAFGRYALVIRRNDGVEPKKVTWILWAVSDTIIAVGMYAENVLNAQMVGVVIGVSIVLFYALKYGAPGWTRSDKWLFGFAAAGVVLWILFDDPMLAVVVSLAISGVGVIPTIFSAWEDPSREDGAAWAIFWVACIFGVLAIPKLTFEHAAQPITFLVIESTVMYILFVQPFVRRFLLNQAN